MSNAIAFNLKLTDLMKSYVLGSSHYFKVFYSVICLIFVSVMNYLGAMKFAAQVQLHYPAVHPYYAALFRFNYYVTFVRKASGTIIALNFLNRISVTLQTTPMFDTITMHVVSSFTSFNAAFSHPKLMRLNSHAVN